MEVHRPLWIPWCPRIKGIAGTGSLDVLRGVEAAAGKVHGASEKLNGLVVFWIIGEIQPSCYAKIMSYYVHVFFKHLQTKTGSENFHFSRFSRTQTWRFPWGFAPNDPFRWLFRWLFPSETIQRLEKTKAMDSVELLWEDALLGWEVLMSDDLWCI